MLVAKPLVFEDSASSSSSLLLSSSSRFVLSRFAISGFFGFLFASAETEPRVATWFFVVHARCTLVEKKEKKMEQPRGAWRTTAGEKLDGEREADVGFVCFFSVLVDCSRCSEKHHREGEQLRNLVNMREWGRGSLAHRGSRHMENSPRVSAVQENERGLCLKMRSGMHNCRGDGVLPFPTVREVKSRWLNLVCTFPDNCDF